MNDTFLPPIGSGGGSPDPETDRETGPFPDALDDAPHGEFTWDVAGDRWWWSDEVFAIHGFEPGQVLPTTDLLMTHKHPEDLEQVRRALAQATAHGGRFSVYHRIVDSQRRVRHVLAVGTSIHSDQGGLVEMTGLLIDLTDCRRRDLQPGIEAALQDALQHRSVIEQAKGAIMLDFGIDADAAFAVLRSSSSVSNIKVKDLAQRLVTELASGFPGSGARIDALLAVVTDPGYVGGQSPRS